MRIKLYLFLVSGFAIAVVYNGCANSFSSASSSRNSANAAQCNSILQAEFEKLDGYYSFLSDSCASCHVIGGSGNGGFADPVATQAFDQFAVRGAVLVGSRAVDANHVAGVTGPQHQDTVDTLNAEWATAEARFDACVASNGGNNNGGNNGGGEGILPDDPTFTQATMNTNAKAINANANTPTTLSWDLGNELPGVNYAGATLSVDVQTFETPTGDMSYILSNLRLSTGGQALHLIYVDITINGALSLTATTYRTVNRRLEAGAATVIDSANMVIPMAAINAGDTLSLGIGQLNAINFSPQSYTQLVGGAGVLGQNCASCHGQGGANRAQWDMTSYNNLFTDGVVSPFSPNGSRIFIRMNDAANPMPPSGVLPQGSINTVRDWIWDGAPQN